MIRLQTKAPSDSSSSETEETEAKVLLVDSGDREVTHDPEIIQWLALGWSIRRAVPRIVEGGKAKCLVVLERSTAKESLPIPERIFARSQSRRQGRPRKVLDAAPEHGTVKR